MRTARNVCVLCVVLGWSAGCGGGKPAAPKNRPARMPATGVVLYKGAPLAGATITFSNEDATAPSAFAITDAQGKFVMGTFGADDGVIPGSYKVTVAKIETPPAPPTAATGQPGYDPNPPPPPKPKYLAPKKYADTWTTPLGAKIGKEPPPEFKFELAD